VDGGSTRRRHTYGHVESIASVGVERGAENRIEYTRRALGRAQHTIYCSRIGPAQRPKTYSPALAERLAYGARRTKVPRKVY